METPTKEELRDMFELELKIALELGEYAEFHLGLAGGLQIALAEEGALEKFKEAMRIIEEAKERSRKEEGNV